MLKKILIWSAVAIVSVMVAAVFVPGFVADSIYKNVDDLVDGEMPTTVTSFESGPEVVSIIGGSGEGLNCSLPAGIDILFDGSENAAGKRHLVRQRFRQACVFHDLCYRHGLATYGYNQNDCDRVLQNQAFRLCLYLRNDNTERGAQRCQDDSKLVLAGVSLGGFGSYRGWDKSTYFEFESDPARSNGYSVSRVVDHPFKTDRNPAKYRGESDQVILTFANERSSLTVTCVTCKDLTIQEWTRYPDESSDELKSVGLEKLPQALLTHEDLKLSDTSPIWLPPQRRHAAPHLLIDSTGKNYLIWMSRKSLENTTSCIVLAEPARLLTYTMPKLDLCKTTAGSRLTLMEVDMFSSSPLPMEIPGSRLQDHIIATGLSGQTILDNSLAFCLRPLPKTAGDSSSDDDRSSCTPLLNPNLSSGLGLGAFQNFAVVRKGQQLFFARDVALPKTSNPLKKLLEHIEGNTYSPSGAMVMINVAPPAAANGAASVTVQKIVPFTIDDRFDPIMPMTRSNSDLRFLSLLASGTKVGIHTFDFAADYPKVGDVGLTMNRATVELDRSWALRPMLVLETREDQPKNKLVLSRGLIVPEQGKSFDRDANVDTVFLESLVLERNATDSAKTSFSVTVSAACRVTYRFQSNTDHPCRRAYLPKRTMRASPAAKMLASQLLVGHFVGRRGHGIAFIDACMKNNPIVLRQKDGTKDELVATVPTVKKEGLERNVVCDPLNKIERVSQRMSAKVSYENSH